MNTATLEKRQTRESILSAFEAAKSASPKKRARDIAHQIGISEAELLSARTSDDIVRLEGDPADLIRALPGIGRIMSLTRNAHCVHEKHGEFGNITIGPGHAIVLNHHIDLRLFMSHWRWTFAVTENVASGHRSSFQFFDIDGRAVHKVYVDKTEDLAPFHALVSRFRADDQTLLPKIVALPPSPAETPDHQIDTQGFMTHWAALQDTHDFFGLLREFGIARRQSMRLAEGHFTRCLDATSVKSLLEAAASDGTPIMCFVGNPGCIQIHTGPVERVEMMGPWLNVLDADFNLHLDNRGIESVWAVEKPTRDGVVTSVEVYNAEGHCFCQFFGERKPGQTELSEWREIVSSLREPGT